MRKIESKNYSTFEIEFFVSPMGEFFANVARYPKYLITIILGVFTAVLEPLIKRSSNPVTGISLVAALISGLITIGLILRAMVSPTSLA